MRKRILIIGASGYLGGHLFQAQFGEKIIGTFYQNYKPGLKKINLCDYKETINLIKDSRPDLILFAAGITQVDKCQLEPSLAFKVNAESVKKIANISGARIVYYSTDYVFDGKKGYYNENSSPNPLNVYGQSKLYGEKAVLKANKSNLVIRVSGLYGVHSIESFNGEQPIFAEDDRFSSPIHLDDVVSATRLLLQKNASGIFHVGAPLHYSRYEFQQLLGFYSKSQRIVIPTNSFFKNRIAPRPANTSLSTEKMSLLGWKAHNVPNGLKKSFEFHNIKSKCRGGTLAEIVEKQFQIKAILIDCVGGLLTKRTWNKSDPLLDKVDIICGKAYSKEEIQKVITKHNRSNGDLNQIIQSVAHMYVPNPPVWSCLHYWRSKYKLALVNNGLSNTFHIWINRYGLDDIFDILANSNEIGLWKPEPSFFLKISELLNVSTNQCLLIDDKEENIIGAKKSGMFVLQTFSQKGFPLLGHDILSKNDCAMMEIIRTLLTQYGFFQPITASTSFRSMGLDSLDIVRIICRLEKELSIKLEDSIVLNEIDKINDLIEKFKYREGRK